MGNDRCDCCLRDLRELRPFGRGGYRFNGDFNGESLCKTERPINLLDGLEDKVYEEFFGHCQTDAEYKAAEEAMVQAYGEKITQEITYYALSKRADVWLCRQCIALDWDEYDEKWREGCLLECYSCQLTGRQ